MPVTDLDLDGEVGVGVGVGGHIWRGEKVDFGFWILVDRLSRYASKYAYGFWAGGREGMRLAYFFRRYIYG